MPAFDRPSRRDVPWSRRAVLAGFGGVGLTGCGRAEPRPEPEPAAVAPATEISSDPLKAAIEGVWRPAAERARDRWRRPRETLTFFGLQPGWTVVEFWPGAGWWTQILAPYARATRGRYVAAHLEGAQAADREIVARFRERFSNRALYGEVVLSTFGPASAPPGPAGSADLVLFMRNIHNWMAAGLAEKAFRDAHATLKPGGVLGVEQHRASPSGLQDPVAASGYVKEAFVRQLAEEAGFRFDRASEINANSKDDRDHPFGVWTLPPVRRTSPRGEPENPGFDRAPFDAVGESDRMTLRFLKR
jgi:predicted methyltransferase